MNRRIENDHCQHDPIEAKIATLSSPAKSHLSVHLDRIDQAANSPEYREEIFERLFRFSSLATSKLGDHAIVLGTSMEKYPDKFKKRIFWASRLLYQSQANSIIFTGRQDHATNDSNQAEDAKQFAVNQCGIPPEKIFTVGGDNTQQNFQEARKIFNNGSTSCFIITENHHMLRAITVARAEFNGYRAVAFPSPVDGVQKLDANNPRHIIELIKAITYQRLLYNQPRHVSPSELEIIRKILLSKVRYLEKHFRSQITAEHEETPFEEWVKQYQ